MAEPHRDLGVSKIAAHGLKGRRSSSILFALGAGLLFSACQPPRKDQESAPPNSAAASGSPAPDGGFPVMNADRAVEGFVLFKQNCSTGHDHPSGPTPSRAVLGSFTRERIYAALTTGVMKPMAAGLTDAQRRLLAAMLPQEKPLREPSLTANMCKTPTPPAEVANASWPGWSPDLTNRGFQPAGGLAATDVPRLKLKWAFAYPAGVGGLPVVSDGWLYSASAKGDVFALDARTGCTRWTAKVPGEVRGAQLIGTVQASGGAKAQVLFVADALGNVTAFDARTGKQRWATRPFTGTTRRISGSPVLFGNRLFVPIAAFESQLAPVPTYEGCKARGGLAAIDAGTGRVAWSKDVFTEPVRPTRVNAAGAQNYGPAGGSVWSAPTVDPKRGLVYVTTGNAYTEPASKASDALIAFDLRTGQIRSSSQALPQDAWVAGCDRKPHANCPRKLGPDSDLSMPAALVTLKSGKDILVSASKGGVVYAFDPDNKRKFLWQTRLARSNPQGSLTFGSAIIGEISYFLISFDQPEGGLAAVDLSTGRQIWRKPARPAVCSWGKDFCSAAQRSPPSATRAIIFAGSNDGYIRAYAAGSGDIVWRFDMAKTINAVNGAQARGGAMGRGGQTLAGGIVYVNAGAGLGRGGNALMAFSVDGH